MDVEVTGECHGSLCIRLPEAWGLNAYHHQVLNIFHLVGFSHRKSASDAIISVLQRGVKGEDMESVWGEGTIGSYLPWQNTLDRRQVILPFFPLKKCYLLDSK